MFIGSTWDNNGSRDISISNESKYFFTSPHKLEKFVYVLLNIYINIEKNYENSSTLFFKSSSKYFTLIFKKKYKWYYREKFKLLNNNNKIEIVAQFFHETLLGKWDTLILIRERKMEIWLICSLNWSMMSCLM